MVELINDYVVPINDMVNDTRIDQWIYVDQWIQNGESKMSNRGMAMGLQAIPALINAEIPLGNSQGRNAIIEY